MARTLEERIQHLEDIHECEQLQYAYQRYVDNGYDPEGIASLFTPDGLWEIKGTGGTAKGREAIKQHAKNLSAAITWGQHNMMTPSVIIGEDGKTATGAFCLICMLTMIETGKKDAYILVGRYSNRYVKINGKWYFSELTGVIDQTAPWDKGWVKAPMTRESW